MSQIIWIINRAQIDRSNIKDLYHCGYGEILADALGSGSSSENCAGSNPAIRNFFGILGC